ncbi:MAG TPA: hypothetical protein DC048_04840, partial [Planctomycetaceae bacterium]|nr:hypothetical protein [Planctomycetaceae bacterium]
MPVLEGAPPGNGRHGARGRSDGDAPPASLPVAISSGTRVPHPLVSGARAMTTRRCPPPATSATAAASQALIRQHRRRATRRDHRTAALAVERLHARAMLSASPWTVSSLDAERAAEAVLARLGGAEPATLVTIHNVEGRPMLARTAYATAAAATSALNGLRRDPRLVSVEVDQPVTLLVEPFTTTDASSDPLRGALWGLDRLGVEPVWSVTTGADVDVAVLDTGVAYHEDLAGLFGPGADFSDAGGNGRNDGHSHGTHVAGTIAATARNARGIAGVAPGVRIMPVKVLGDTGSGSAGAVAEGIIWAADNGAEVITMSLGGTTRSSAMEMAVSYALQRGVTVIAAAGNSRAWGSPLSYPAAYEGVVAVAATTPQDTVASFSTGNASVDIAAPGTGIWSTIPGDRYAAYNGTSMATPHVAAVAALVHARAADLGASVNVPGILLETARDLGAPGRDDDFGRGLVDPVAAVLAVGSTAAEPPPAPVNLQAESTWWSRATVTWSLPVDPLSVTGVRLAFANGDAAALVPGTATSAVVTGLQPQTTYTLYATSIGRTKGSERSAPITFTTPARPDFAGDSLQTAARLPASFRVAELLDTVDDVDWWTFTLQSRLDKPEVRLTNLPSDYTVELSYEFNGRLTQLWRGLNVGTKDELSQLGRFHYWDSGRYFIKVFVSRYGTFSETQPYRLEILSNGMPLSREPAPT